MPKFAISTVFGVFLAQAIVFAPAAALACSCRPYDTTKQAYDQADLVFAGRVTALKTAQSDSWDAVEATIAVRKIWKGQGKKITLMTNSETAACGFPMVLGQPYLIFAFEQDGEITTNLCSGSRDLTGGGLEILDLDEIEHSKAAD